MSFLGEKLDSFLNHVLDIFLPRFCVVCKCEYSDTKFEYNYLCRECLSILPKLPHKFICIKCKGYLGEYLLKRPFCQQCKKNKHLFKKLITPLYYKDEVENLIQDYKFNRRLYIGKLLTQLLVESIKGEVQDYYQKINFITFVPMTYTEKFKRGFNQSEFIAHIVGEKLKIKVLDALKKIRTTRHQMQLNFYDRQRNVKGAFSVKRRFSSIINGKNILLIDDIYTTGSTMAECCKTLKENGVKQIYLAVLARNTIK